MPAASVTRDKTIPGVASAAAPDFEATYAEHFDYVYRVVVRLADRRHAEDLAQEVWAVVYRRLPEFEGRAKITTWLFQIAYRVVGNHIRREKVRRGFLALVGKAPDEWHEQSALRAPSALSALDSAQAAARLTAAVAALPWKKRAVLVLHEVEGWPCDVIALRLGVPVATVYTRLHHARNQLAAALEGVR